MSEKIAELKQQLEADPKNDALWLALGDEYNAQDLFEEAVDAYSNGIIQNPFNKACYQGRGRKYISLQRYLQAVADFTMASRLDPYDNEVWYYQGVAAHLAGLYDRCEEAFPKAIERMKADGVDEWLAGVDWLWLTYMAQGKKAEAQEIIKLVDKDTPCIPRSLSYKKRGLLYRGDVKPEEFMDREHLKTTDRPELYLISECFGLGNYYLAMGDKEKAIPLLKEARDVPTWHSSFAYRLACRRLEELGL